MSATYPDLIHTNFPEQSYEEPDMIDIDAELLPFMNQYYSYMSVGNTQEAINLLNNNPRLLLAIYNADKHNKQKDTVSALTRMFINDIHDYIATIIQNKGDWVNNIKYRQYNTVFYTVGQATQMFVCLPDVGTEAPMGTLPTNTAYFKPLTIKGDTGASGIGLAYCGNYTLSKEYKVNDCVSCDNILWACTQTTLGNTPSKSSTYWSVAMELTKQFVTSTTQPASQSTDDYWLEKDINDGVKFNKRNPDGSYTQMMPKTTASNVATQNGQSVEDITTKTYIHAKNNGVNEFSGAATTAQYYTMRFKPTSDCTATDTYKINGVTYTAQTSSGETLPDGAFKNGIATTCEVDTTAKTINFKLGLGSAKLLNFPLSISNTKPTNPKVGEIHVDGNATDYSNVKIDDAMRLSDIDGTLALLVDDTNNGLDIINEKRTINGKSMAISSHRYPISENYMPLWNINGFINYLKCDYLNETQNGITIITNKDGSYTLNGTATQNARFIINSGVRLESAKITFGCKTTLPAQLFISVYVDGAEKAALHDVSITRVLSLDRGLWTFDITAYTGCVLNNLTIYPYVKYGENTDQKYVPYNSQNIIARKKPIVMSKKNNVIDVETAYMYNGSSWDTLSQKGHYMLATYTTAPYVRVMYNTDGIEMKTHIDLEGIGAITSLSYVNCIEVSNNNKWYIIGTLASSGSVLIWYRQGDTFTKITTPSQIGAEVTSVGFSKDGTKVAFGTSNGYVIIFSISGSTLTFVKTISVKSSSYIISNIKFTSSKMVVVCYYASDCIIFTYDLSSFNQIATASVGASSSPNRCLETFTDSGKEYALVLCSNNTMYLCELGASTITVTNSGVVFDGNNPRGFRQSFDTRFYVGQNNYATVIDLYKRNGLTFTKCSGSGSFQSEYCTFDINSNIYTNKKTKYAIENDLLVSKGTYTTPHTNSDKLLTLAPSY